MMKRFLLAAALVAAPASFAGDNDPNDSGDAEIQARSIAQDLTVTMTKVRDGMRAASALAKPNDLSPLESRIWDERTAWEDEVVFQLAKRRKALADSLDKELEDILAETASSQSYLLGIQAEVSAQQTTYSSVSNALNTKMAMERSAIQNFRA